MNKFNHSDLKQTLFNDAIKDFKITFVGILDYQDLEFIEVQKDILLSSFEIEENFTSLKSKEYKNELKNKLKTMFFDRLNDKDSNKSEFNTTKKELQIYKNNFWNRKKSKFRVFGCEILVISNKKWTGIFDRELYIYTKDARIPLFIDEMNIFYQRNYINSERYSLIEVFAKILKKYSFKYEVLVLNMEIFEELVNEVLLFLDSKKGDYRLV